MTPKHRSHPRSGTRALRGAVAAAMLGLVVLSLAVPGFGHFRWILVPLVVVTIAGGLGGVAFAVTDPLRRAGGWRRTAANALSVLFYCVIVSAAFIVTLNTPR